MGRLRTYVDNRDLTVMLRHLRDHYWCVQEALHHGEEGIDTEDSFDELRELLDRYRDDLSE